MAAPAELRRGAGTAARGLALPVLAALFAVLLATQAPAQQASAPVERDPVIEAKVTRLATELRCPVCQGLSIQDSPSDLAIQMKDVIRTQLEAGATEQDVRDYFVSKYGEWVLLEPRASGFNLLVYLLPGLALLGGGVLIAVSVRRWTAAPAPEAASREA